MKKIEKVTTTYNITKQDLAKILGVSSNYVYMLNSGAKPMPDKINQQLDEILANGLPDIHNLDNNSYDNETIKVIMERLDNLELDIKLIKKLINRPHE